MVPHRHHARSVAPLRDPAKEKQQSKIEVGTFILGYTCELELLTGERVERAVEETVVLWSPSKPFVQVNFDAGFYKELEAASMGIVIRNITGLIMEAACLWNRHVPNALAVEVLAGTQTLRFA
ncbi:hypothetical protein Golax_017190 [Gossypium laxum]|uniref:RNase H type-1 domain-containing protein n=1 Tax=Gossypium laxum TaxID=34288 RepID=A0A7J8Z0Z7_9ROSI|nr:hypothetical protein [Gossypium laxum]